MAYIPASNSVVGFQSQPSSLLVGASVIGLTPVNVVNAINPSSVYVINPVSTLSITTGNTSVQLLQGNAVIGSVTTLQGTTPWVVNQPSPSIISYQLAGSVMATSATISMSPTSVQLLAGNAAIGSVTALQGTNPWQVSMPSPSVIAYQLAGSVLAVSGSFSSGNSSVTLLGGGTVYKEKDAVTASALGIPILFKIDETNSVLSTVSPQSPLPIKGSVAVLQGTNPWTVSNPSVVVNNIVTGQSSVYLIPGVGVLGSVATLQGTNPWVVNVPTPSYIAYQLAGSVMAVDATVNTGNSSVQLLGGVATIGSVATLQGTNPWIVNVPTPSYIAYQLAGSVLAVSGSFSSGNSSVELLSTSASIATQVNRILTGVSSVQLMAGINNAGSITAIQGTNPWVIGNNSVLAFQGTTPWTVNSILGTYQEKATAGNASAFGQVMLFKNNVTTSTLAAVSTLDPLPVTGSISTLQGTNPWQVNMPSPSVVVIHPAGSVVQVRTDNASVVAVLSNSSVAVLQGTNPWTVGPSSVQLISTSASIIANQTFGYGSVMLMASTNSSVAVLASQGTNPWVIGSIVGTYAEDSAHTTASSGVFVLGVRNDAVSSMTSAEGDYSPRAVDAVGRTIVKPFAGEQACIISYFGSVVSGSVTLIAASIIGSRGYITDFWVANTGSVANLVTFQGGDTSILGFTIAPAGGGSNSQGINIPLRTTLSQDLAFKTTGTSSIIYMTVKGFQAP